MKGDFTRLSFAARKNYTQVLKQQGRVELDSDWNEQGAILDYLRRTALRDVIGTNGIPKGIGFDVGLSEDGEDLVVGPGRVYVDGLVCDAEASVTEAIRAGDEVSGQTDLVLLDVWERHVTALEDPEIREVALGGPDTTTRLQTVWGVRILRDAGADCDSDDDAWLPAPSGGRLTTGVEIVAPTASPCDLPPNGGFRGLENRLYRVEIQEGGDLGTATWKWSRDNGAVVFAIEEFPASLPDRVRVRRLGRDQVLTLRKDDWVEIIDDDAEIAGTPGFMARVENVDDGSRLVTLDRDVPAGTFDPSKHARVRRWNQQAGTDADGVLTTAAGPIEIEYGIEISFSGSDFRVGDYWMFAARTATRDVEALQEVAPHGIEHHFCRLATIFWEDTGEATPTPRVEPCDLDFPPLTDITAADVSYDDANCDLTGAETVQDAIDRLCKARDLRHHNKHLHGWGIVCGLQVHCGADVASEERREVTIRPGYAIDCDGNDIILEENESIDVLTAISALDEEDPDDPVLDDNGDGEVCLRIERDGQSGRRFTFEKYAPEQKGIQALLQGTLLLDFYNHCIKKLVDWVIDEFTPDEGEEEMLVGPTHRRITTFLNLLVQLWNPTHGRYVFLSLKEHRILRNFYDGLRGLLQSKTFCAMFEDARQFPEYPFEDERHSTIFGKGNHSRLRLDPRSRFAYTVGASNRIHAYDLEREEMVADVEFPGGEGAIVRDVAFPTGGQEVYAVATVNNSTLFAVGDVADSEFRWRPVSITCDCQLVTFGTWRGAENTIFAIGKGMGLYSFDPTEPQVRPELVQGFNAVGHLIIDEERGTAWATASSGESITDTYDSFLELNLSDPDVNPVTVQLRNVNGAIRTGDDDITFDPRNELVAIVVDGANGGTKELLLYDVEANAPRLTVPDLENTAIRLAYSPRTELVVLSFEDSFRLDLVDTEQGLIGEYRHPVQMSPMAIAVSADAENAYVLNQVSNTINTIPAEYLSAEGQIDVEVLAEYRTGVIEAFMDLLGGFLQYLKDCFCDHLLVNCPDCDEEDDIYLACVSVRGGEVYRVCNFSRRKYVKSFPTVGYWLSVIPIWPLMKKVVERFCCSLPVLFFNQRTAPQSFAYEEQAKSSRMRQGLSFAQGTDFRAATRQFNQRLDIAKVLTRDWAGTRTFGAGPTTVSEQEVTVKQSEVLNQSVEAASGRLAERNVTVTEVKTYDAAAGARNLVRVTTAPTELKAGQRVELYEQDGKVKYYSVVTDRPPLVVDGVDTVAAAESRARFESELEVLRAEVTELKTSGAAAPIAQPSAEIDAELKALRDELTELRTAGTTTVAQPTPEMDAELKALRDEVAEIRTAAAAETAVQPSAEVDAELKALRDELSTMQEVIATRDQQISELTVKSTELQRDLQVFGDLQGRIERLERPEG